jgi:alpha-1,6-mannosyltransferase
MKGLLEKLRSDLVWNMILFLFFTIAVLLINYTTSQDEFIKLITLCIPAFAIYWIAQESPYWKFWLYGSILIRFALLFTFPNLSDDIYRFIWDGYLLQLGYDPFQQLPSYYIEQGLSSQFLTEELYAKLNSKEYFSVYPPFAQLVFYISTSIAGTNINLASTIIKALILASETGTIILIINILKITNLKTEKVLLYALNPLILIELMGNIHFEAFMICFFLAGIYLLIKNKSGLAALLMGLSIASKLITLIPQIYLLKRLGIKKSIAYCFVMLIALILFFTPIFSKDFITNFSSSLDLYFRNFEFNASIYYFTNGVVKYFKGYGLISIVGPSLSILTFCILVFMAIRDKEEDYLSFIRLSFWAICIYLMFSTTVHPWYLSLPIALGVFTRFRFIYLWSLLAFLSYSKYSTFEDYYYILLWLEYILVFTILYLDLRALFVSRRLKVE